MGIYDDIAGEVTNVLGTFGQLATINQPPVANSDTTYDPSTGTNAPGTSTSSTIKCALFDFNPGQQFFHGTLILQDDKKLIMEAKSGVKPTLRDELVIGGVAYTIVGIHASNPAGTPVAYTLHLRK